MKIYTKTGDLGTTSLIGGVRTSKSSLRIDSYGQIDELNVYTGLLRDLEDYREWDALLKEIQDRLFTIGSNLALAPDKSSAKIPDLLDDDVVFLEQAIDKIQLQLKPLKAFILPGGHLPATYGHVARTVCRRAERAVVRLAETELVEEIIIVYLNRLSDLFFVLTRWVNEKSGVEEYKWEPRR